jgi:hypothetical protein
MAIVLPVLSFSPQRPRFNLWSGYEGHMVDKVAPGHVFSEHPGLFINQDSTHTHFSHTMPWAGTTGPLMAYLCQN